MQIGYANERVALSHIRAWVLLRLPPSPTSCSRATEALRKGYLLKKKKNLSRLHFILEMLKALGQAIR